MGKKGKEPSWSLPVYEDPKYKTFNTGQGSTSYENGQFSYNPNEAGNSFQTELDATRSAILKHMGGSDQATNDSLNNWQQTYFDEANRLSAPALSNGLFERGLGGSQYYAGTLNDLISKNANSAILNKYQLQNQDFNQNQTAFTNVNNAQQQLQGNAKTLLDLQAQYATNQDAQNYDMYKTTLPYKAKYDAGEKGQGYGGIIGGVIGGVGGAFVGGPMGAVTGAQLGSSIGGGVDATQGYDSYGSQVYQPTLNALSMANLPSSGNVAGTGMFGSNFGGQTQSQISGMNTAQYRNIMQPGQTFNYLR